jgi:hypothetical protein
LARKRKSKKDKLAYYKAKNDRTNRAKLLTRYGITGEEYDEMLLSQFEKCAICAGTNVSGRRLSVDHNHKTGKVRGLLCNQCNLGLGYFYDNPTLLTNASQYLVERDV